MTEQTADSKEFGKEFFERVQGQSGLEGFLDALKFDGQGLVTVVTQDYETGTILMVAHADRTAITASLAGGQMHYFSRSRNKLWKKGEESGHVQELKELRVDCDGDALLAKVTQSGGACHLGYSNCFAWRINKEGVVEVVGDKVFDPNKTYE